MTRDLSGPAAFPTAAAVVLLAAGAALVPLVGCSEEPAAEVVQAPPPPPPRPTAPPKPAITPVTDLMAQLGIDDRILLDERDAPSNDPDRRAVLEFFDAFVRGDTQTLGSMMSDLDRMELEALAGTAEWETALQDVDEVILETGPGPYEQKCALARFMVGDEIQPQLWYYEQTGETYRFDAVPTPPNIMDRLHGTDWIARWHELLEEEIALANKLDEDIELEPIDITGDAEPRATGSRATPGPAGPGAPGFGRRPAPPKRKPPGARK